MNNRIQQSLTNWGRALDEQVRSYDSEILDRQESRARGIEIRSDLDAFVVYMQNLDIPKPVARTLQRCLSWNPYTRGDGDV